MQTLTQPTLLLKPFAESGDKNTIPSVNTDTSNPQLADLTNGFPQITSMSPDNGGLPPERKDFNGLGYLTTTYDYFYQAGGTFTWNDTICQAIGGYPLGARLWYTDSNGDTNILRSTKGNNTDNFTTNPSFIGTSWVKDTPTTSEVDLKISVLLSTLYPVGSIYIGTQTTCPLASLITGSVWDIVATDKALWGGNGSNANTTIAAGLPNITGGVSDMASNSNGSSTYTGAFKKNSGSGGYGHGGVEYKQGINNVSFNASWSNSIYGSSSTVQPPAYRVNVWRRTA